MDTLNSVCHHSHQQNFESPMLEMGQNLTWGGGGGGGGGGEA